MTILHLGFDGLDVAFAGTIPADLRAVLDTAQADARRTMRPVVVEWRGERFEVAETGARGGYRWRLDTGPLGATWFVKDGADLEDPTAWNLRCSWKSAPLATLGLGRVTAETYRFLEAIGATVTAESIGRVDFACDVRDEGFRLFPDHVITHSRTKHNPHRINEDDGAGWGFPEDMHAVSGRYTGVTCGKMPGRQVIIYDKTLDIREKRKVEWWEIWRKADPTLPDDCRVWRIEVRAGKEHLKDDWQITTWRDLAARWGDVVRHALVAVRLTVPTADTNRARWPLHPLWEAVRDATARDLMEMHAGVDPCRVKAVRRADLQAQFRALMIGLYASYAMVLGEDADGIADRAAHDFKEYAKEYRADYVDRVKRARGRYWFFGEDDADPGTEERASAPIGERRIGGPAFRPARGGAAVADDRGSSVRLAG